MRYVGVFLLVISLAAACGRRHPPVSPVSAGCITVDSTTLAELRAAMADTAQLAEVRRLLADTAAFAELRGMLADTARTAELERLMADTSWVAQMRPRMAEVEAEAARLDRCQRR